jgi:hypothetical protein
VVFPDPVKAAPYRGVFALSFGWGGAGCMVCFLVACVANRAKENRSFNKRNNRPRTQAELMNMTEYQQTASVQLKQGKAAIRDGLKAWSNMLAGGQDKDDSDDDSSIEGEAAQALANVEDLEIAASPSMAKSLTDAALADPSAIDLDLIDPSATAESQKHGESEQLLDPEEVHIEI